MILAGVAAALSGMSDWFQPSLQAVIFFACAVVASPLKVALPGVSSSLSINYVLILLSASTFGIGQTIITAVACTITQCFWRPKKRPRLIHVAFNISSATVASWICYHAYHIPWIKVIDGSLPIRMFVASVGLLSGQHLKLAVPEYILSPILLSI